MFIQQLKTLADAKNIYQSYAFYLLESLASVKSVVLLLDVDDGRGEREKLLQQLFGLLFDLAPLPGVSKTAKLYLLEIAQSLIEESDLVSLDIAAFIVQKCGDVRSDTQAFATTLMQSCADKLQPAIGLLFSERLLSEAASTSRVEGPTDRGAPHERQRWESIRTIHAQMLQVGRVAPSALANVIPQLEDELQADEQELRMIAISHVGQLLVVSKGQVQKMYNTLWQAWVNKMNDKAPAARLLWLKTALELLPELEGASKDVLQEAIGEKLQDIDAKVRERCLQLLAKFIEDGQGVLHLGLAVIQEIANRCRDKQEDVRIAAMTVLCQAARRIYKAPGKENWLATASNALFKLIYTSDRDLRIFYEYFLEHSLMTAPTSGERGGSLSEHAHFLVAAYSHLDEEAHKAFKKWLSDKSLFVRYFEAYIKLAMGNPEDPRLATVNQHLSNLFRVPLDALAMLQALPVVLLKRKEWQARFALITSAEAPLSKLREATTAIIDEDWSRSDARLKTFLMTFMVRRGTLLPINGATITAILEIADRELLPHAQRLVADIISEFPALGVKHTSLMEEAVCQYSDDLGRLAAFARFAGSCASRLAPSDALFDTLSGLIINGSRKQAKLAVRIVKCFPSALQNLLAIFRESIPSFPTLEGMQLVRFWQVTAELAGTGALAVLEQDFDAPFQTCMAPLFDPAVGWPSSRTGAPLDAYRTEEICGVLAIRSARNALLALKTVSRDSELQKLRIWAPRLLDWLGALRSPRVQLTAVKALVCLVPRPSAQTLASNLAPLLHYAMHCPTPLRDRLNSFILRQYQMGSVGMIYLLLPILSLVLDGPGGRGALKESLQSVKKNDRFAEPLVLGGSVQHSTVAIDSRGVCRYEDWFVVALIILALVPQFELLREASVAKLTGTLELMADFVVSESNVSFIFEAVVQLKRYSFAGEQRQRSKHLYILSELAQNVLRQRASAHRWALEAVPVAISVVDELLTEIQGVEQMSKNVQRSYLDRMARKASQSSSNNSGVVEQQPNGGGGRDKESPSGNDGKRRTEQHENDPDSGNNAPSSSSTSAESTPSKNPRTGLRRSARNRQGQAHFESLL